MSRFYEENVLDKDYRKRILFEIMGGENVARKQEYLKRQEIYKDRTKDWVIRSLEAEGLKAETVAQMTNRGANISIAKKIVNKKARVYNEPPLRTVGGENENTRNEQDEQREKARDHLDWNAKMKKSDRYLELHKNSYVMLVPRLDQPKQSDPDLKKLVMRVMPPWQYDVIEDPEDKEKERALIISEFHERSTVTGNAISESQAGIHSAGNVLSAGSVAPGTNNHDDVIADSPHDAGLGHQREFIWWTDSYHFTTDEHGNIIPEKSPEDNTNPIGVIPGCRVSSDQDGHFWAQGGEDLVEGSILINKTITDMFFVLFLQGFGQVVVTGKNILNQNIQVGPNNLTLIEVKDEDDPTPTVDILSSNPPIQSWINAVELYTALLLTTNNLSPGNVSSKLDISNFASGIALMIELSEVAEDISDKHNDFSKCERKLDRVLSAWSQLYYKTNELNEFWTELGEIPTAEEFQIKYRDPRPPISEKEKLENIRLRKDLGINEMVDLMRIDNPDLTEEQAKEKLLRIAQERLERMNAEIETAFGGGEDEDEDEDEDEEGDGGGVKKDSTTFKKDSEGEHTKTKRKSKFKRRYKNDDGEWVYVY